MTYADPAKRYVKEREWRLAHAEQTYAYQKAYQLTHRPELNALARDRTARRYGILQDIKMESGCADCGYKEHPEALEFDHVRGEKLFTISASMARSAAVMEAEIAKCEVVCSNCHHVRSAQRKESDEPWEL